MNLKINIFSRKFFETLGGNETAQTGQSNGKSVEETPRSVSTMSPIEKVNLWLPATRTKERSLMDEKQKASLLAKMNIIDNEPKDLNYDTRAQHQHQQIYDDNEPIKTETMTDIKSQQKKSDLMNELFGTSITQEVYKDDTFTSPRPLKTSLKTSVGARKSVKFYEEEVDNRRSYTPQPNDLF